MLDQVKNDLNISADNKDKKEGTFINIKMKKDLRLYETQDINCKGYSSSAIAVTKELIFSEYFFIQCPFTEYAQ